MKKNAFPKIASLISIILVLVAIILGSTSTIAWFEDTDEKINNFVIGDMKVTFWYSSPTLTSNEWKPLTQETKLFSEDALYEPGYTDIVYIKVTNEEESDVSVTCDFSVWATNIIKGMTEKDEEIYLPNYLKYGVVYGKNIDDIKSQTATRELARNLATKNITDIVEAPDKYEDINIKVAPEESEYAAVIVYMPTEVGNEAKHGLGKQPPSVDLGITVTATQVH